MASPRRRAPGSRRVSRDSAPRGGYDIGPPGNDGTHVGCPDSSAPGASRRAGLPGLCTKPARPQGPSAWATPATVSQQLTQRACYPTTRSRCTSTAPGTWKPCSLPNTGGGPGPGARGAKAHRAGKPRTTVTSGSRPGAANSPRRDWLGQWPGQHSGQASSGQASSGQGDPPCSLLEPELRQRVDDGGAGLLERSALIVVQAVEDQAPDGRHVPWGGLRDGAWRRPPYIRRTPPCLGLALFPGDKPAVLHAGQLIGQAAALSSSGTCRSVWAAPLLRRLVELHEYLVLRQEESEKRM